MAENGNEHSTALRADSEVAVQGGQRTQHDAGAAHLADEAGTHQDSPGANGQPSGVLFTNHASAPCAGVEVTPDATRGVGHPVHVGLPAESRNNAACSDNAAAPAQAVVEAAHVEASDIASSTMIDASIAAAPAGEVPGSGALVSTSGGSDLGAGVGGSRPGANIGEGSSASHSKHVVEEKSEPRVVQPGVEHQQGYCRVTALAFARKFRHVGIKSVLQCVRVVETLG